MVTIVKLVNMSSPHTVTSVHVCMVRAPGTYSVGKFPVLGTVLLTTVIMLHPRMLHSLPLCNCPFVPLDQPLPICSTSLPW